MIDRWLQIISCCISKPAKPLHASSNLAGLFVFTPIENKLHKRVDTRTRRFYCLKNKTRQGYDESYPQTGGLLIFRGYDSAVGREL